MDEGRLAVVLRQEERHRKFVYMLNEAGRARLGLYTNCLSREQHEASLKLLKHCSHMRKSIVRQKVLRKCLEMRKRTIIAHDPTKLFGQYGGKPLWAMSRDIDQVIADNHPRIRRLKRVEEVMRHSLESGAILDQQAVSRRMEAFFQLRQAQRQKETSPQRAQDVPKAPVQRRNVFKPPSWAMKPSASPSRDTPLSQSAQTGSTGAQGRSGQLTRDSKDIERENRSKDKPKELPSKDSHRRLEAPVVTDQVSLDVDSKGRLQGIQTNRVGTNVEVLGDDQSPKKTPSRARAESRSQRQTDRADPPGVQDGEGQYRASEDLSVTRSRSRLILPPIQPSKALVSSTSLLSKP